MNSNKPLYLLMLHLAVVSGLAAQQKATVTIDAATPGRAVSPSLHGVFFEEISHAGEGGLYAELIQNRGFEEANIPPGMRLEGNMIVPPQTPHFSLPDNKVSDWKMKWPIHSDFPAWHYQLTGGASAKVSRTTLLPLNNATPHSLQVDIAQAGKTGTVEMINEGFWGINVMAGEQYKLKFFLRSSSYKGSVTAMLRAKDGSTVASHSFPKAANVDWQPFTATLTATKSESAATFALVFDQPGTVWLDFVSLFPENTFKNRPNGLRKDLAEYIARLKPAFVRWPGGCFVEGITIQSAPDWKQTIGPIEQRPETYSPWGYYASNGFGYHEYLQYCEDIGADALYVFNAGVSCDFRSGTFVPDDSLQPYIQSALDAIEYAIGPATSRWGKVRAAAGHPKPFPLKYVEVGNEQVGPRYARRFNLFYNAIKAKYPQMQIIASMGIGDVNNYTLNSMKRLDYADEHAYKGAGWAMAHYDHFDRYQRGDWAMYVGEYATNAGVGAGDMEAALNDAVYMMSMEKNSDLVKMSSYAPLLVNENDVDWPVNLINFNTAASFARISYYAIKMFNENRPDINLPATVKVEDPVVKQPAFSGGIGLGTWDTKTVYKNIEVLKDGHTVYKSDFANKPEEWSLVRGQWQAQDSGLAQVEWGAQLFAQLSNKNFDTYTLKLKAKKIEGYNAFIIPFAIKDSNTYLRAHIAAWVNRVAMFEKVVNGYEVSSVSSAVNLKDTIVASRWYDIRLDVGLDMARCYLDDSLLMTYVQPQKFFAIAGTDTATGDYIVKMVNAYDTPMSVNLNIIGGRPSNEVATISVLSAPHLTDENSFARPNRFVPKTKKASWRTLVLDPCSIQVVRIKKAADP